MNLYMKRFAPRKNSKTQIRKVGVDKNGEKVYLYPDCYAKATSTVTKPWVS